MDYYLYLEFRRFLSKFLFSVILDVLIFKQIV